VFLGEDLLVWLVLAFGGAMLVGNVGAGAGRRGGVRGVAALWALVSLVGG
jgi:hypothetical protein